MKIRLENFPDDDNFILLHAHFGKYRYPSGVPGNLIPHRGDVQLLCIYFTVLDLLTKANENTHYPGSRL